MHNSHKGLDNSAEGSDEHPPPNQDRDDMAIEEMFYSWSSPEIALFIAVIESLPVDDLVALMATDPDSDPTVQNAERFRERLAQRISEHSEAARLRNRIEAFKVILKRRQV